jgi:LPXTG-motif cell wall-anchored protein
VLSLTRGFAYAGCASMVNSLWKADDEATAAILHQFHIYLQRGYTKSKALRQAKLDYLHSNALYKTPNYWAHLILTGDNQPLVQVVTWYRWLLVIGAVVAVLLGIVYVKRRKKVDVAYTEIRIKIALMCVLRTNADTALSFEVKTSTFRVYPDSIGKYFIKSGFVRVM